ncbi:Diguanylate cyclase DosC [Novipirellula aureliae]|uniref:diguanylate cyclase n=1 Tax=Novipirellula aureliae TaxID=2527966 RepID=A0A5C6E2I0_9BACT|nr:GGDEF domain-containing protein [Novipirellula aureliae]TWU41359.1 Diguanylate cyclase DosC [Novipirellula aureliae]
MSCAPKIRDKKTIDVANAAEYARQALGYIGKFQTPPTPNVYEVWYRYAEGNCPPINEQLSYAIHDAKSADYELLNQLHEQFLAWNDRAAITGDLGEQLSLTIEDVESILSEQRSTHDDFQDATGKMSDRVETQQLAPETLKMCIDSILASNRAIQSQIDKMAIGLDESRSQIRYLRDRYLESQKQIMKDPLTGVGNRLFFETMVNDAINHRQQSNRHSILLLIDLDKFKYVNDTFGHSTGDQVLKFVSTHLERLAVDASVARYGGDEFAVFLSTEQPNGGVEQAETICEFFASNEMEKRETGAYSGKLTISVGGSMLRESDTGSTWFERADRLLYSAKNSGRNRAMVERKIK